jgi:hypothetical protein
MGESTRRGLAPSRTWVQWVHHLMVDRGSATSRPTTPTHRPKVDRVGKNFFGNISEQYYGLEAYNYDLPSVARVC